MLENKRKKRNGKTEKRVLFVFSNSNVYTIFNHLKSFFLRSNRLTDAKCLFVCLKMSAKTITGDCHNNDENVHLCNIVHQHTAALIKKRVHNFSFYKSDTMLNVEPSEWDAVEKNEKRKSTGKSEKKKRIVTA